MGCEVSDNIPKEIVDIIIGHENTEVRCPYFKKNVCTYSGPEPRENPRHHCVTIIPLPNLEQIMVATDCGINFYVPAPKPLREKVWAPVRRLLHYHRRPIRNH